MNPRLWILILRSRLGRGVLGKILSSCKYIFAICLLLALLSSTFVCIAGFYIWETVATPVVEAGLEASQPENLPKALWRTTRYIFLRTGHPLPEDVSLEPPLENLARQRGFEWGKGDFYQVESCIAAADQTGVRRSDLCGLMEYEGGWRSPVKATTFVAGLAIGQFLRILGYNPSDSEIKQEWVEEEIENCVPDGTSPTPIEQQCVEQKLACANRTCEAFLAYFNGDESSLQTFQRFASAWEVANRSVEIRKLRVKENLKPIRFFTLVTKFWTLENIGIPEIHMVGGVPVIVIGPGAPPPNELPYIPDATFLHPVDGGYVSGHRFGIDHQGNPFPQHTGTDYCCGEDEWVRAAHNGTVTASRYVDPSSSLAADIWNSGNVVVIKSQFPDGTPFCSNYGHGANLSVSVDQKVRAGDVVFKMGNTGLSYGIHLHFSIRIGGSGPFCSGGYFVDPEYILPPP